MKKSLALILFVFLLAGCSKGNHDGEAISNVISGLNDRWSFSDELDEDPDIDDYKKSIQLELDRLEKLSIDTFKDIKLYGLYDDYRRELEDGKSILARYNDSSELSRDWFKHSEKRGAILSELHDNYDLDIPEKRKEIFDTIINFNASDLGVGFDTDINEVQGLYYMEEITYRYLNSSLVENDSFEQRSELQACLKRVDFIEEELRDKYPGEDKFALSLIDLGQEVKMSCEEKLEGEHGKDYANSHKLGQLVGDIARLYTDGKLPPTVIKVTGKTTAD